MAKTKSTKQKPAAPTKQKPALAEQQQKIREALKEANESWWILETHVGLLAAAARGDELPAGVAAETIGWHSLDVCEQQFTRINDSLEALQKLAGIDEPLFNDERAEVAS